MKKPTYAKCRHIGWNMTQEGTTAAVVALTLGCDVKDLDVLVYLEGEDALLRDVPIEFRSVLSSMAYDRGHSAGEEECWGILSSLVYDLLPAIQQFEHRIRNENDHR